MNESKLKYESVNIARFMGSKSGLLKKYYGNWEFIMPVVLKIEALGNCQVDISLNWCRIGWKDDKIKVDSRDSLKNPTKMEAVYTACVEFIKKYELIDKD